MSHTMKLWETVVEARLRAELSTCGQQYGFNPRKSTTECSVCFKDVGGEVQIRPEGAALCLCRPRESI